MWAGHRPMCLSGPHSTRDWRIRFQDSSLTWLASWCCELRAQLGLWVRARSSGFSQRVSPRFLWLCHCMVAGFQEPASHRNHTEAARPFLAKSGKLYEVTSTLFLWSPVSKLGQTAGVGTHTIPVKKRGGKGLVPTDPPQKAVSSNTCFV